MSDSLKDQYYKVIADLWGRFPWEDDIRADILETGGAPPPKNAGQIFWCETMTRLTRNSLRKP